MAKRAQVTYWEIPPEPRRGSGSEGADSSAAETNPISDFFPDSTPTANPDFDEPPLDPSEYEPGGGGHVRHSEYEDSEVDLPQTRLVEQSHSPDLSRDAEFLSEVVDAIVPDGEDNSGEVAAAPLDFPFTSLVPPPDTSSPGFAVPPDMRSSEVSDPEVERDAETRSPEGPVVSIPVEPGPIVPAPDPAWFGREYIPAEDASPGAPPDEAGLGGIPPVGESEPSVVFVAAEDHSELETEGPEPKLTAADFSASAQRKGSSSRNRVVSSGALQSRTSNKFRTVKRVVVGVGVLVVVGVFAWQFSGLGSSDAEPSGSTPTEFLTESPDGAFHRYFTSLAAAIKQNQPDKLDDVLVPEARDATKAYAKSLALADVEFLTREVAPLCLNTATTNKQAFRYRLAVNGREDEQNPVWVSSLQRISGRWWVIGDQTEPNWKASKWAEGC